MTKYLFHYVGTSDIFNGRFYRINEDNTYTQLELYLPAATGTYGEPLSDTRDRWIKDLNETDGSIRLRKPLAGQMTKHVTVANGSPYVLVNGKMKRKDDIGRIRKSV